MKNLKMSEEKAITLIALVITIIIMLILAGVSINVITDGKIFSYARRAVEDTKIAAKNENQILEELLEEISVEDGAEDSIQPVLTTPWLFGDVDLDNDVDEDDQEILVRTILSDRNPDKIVLTDEIALMQGDVDANGMIESEDVVLLTQLFLDESNQDKIDILPAQEHATALAFYNVTSSSFKLRIKAQDEDSGLSKIIWHYKLSIEENYTSVEQDITNTKETIILEKEITGLSSGEYTAYVEVFDAKNNKVTSNTVTVTIE